MRLRNNIFAAAFDYLKREKGIKTQKRLAELMGVSEDTITRILKDRCDVTEDIITKLQTASGCIFNLQWLRGEDATHMLAEDLINESFAPQPEIPEYVQRLCEESARLATRNEMLERQCENLIAELRDSKDKNDAFLVELKASQKFNDALVADLRISRTQNDTLISELRETRKQNTVLTSELSEAKSKLDDALLSIEGMKNQLSMMLSHFTTSERANLSTISVNDDGEPVILIQVQEEGKKKVPKGYIKGDLRFITEKMVQQALKAFPDKKK